MWIPMLLLAFLVLGLGLYPSILHPMLNRSVHCVLEMFGVP
jgi:NADH:ubiquinone oxidoreductase subunit 4 (subunit M)